MENIRRESALKVARKSATKTLSKRLRTISTYQSCFGKRLDSTNQSLIKKGAALYEEGKRICEAERKRKAKTDGPPADSMTLACSTCN